MKYPTEYAVVDKVSGFVSCMDTSKKAMLTELKEHQEGGWDNAKWVVVKVTPAIRKRFFDGE